MWNNNVVKTPSGKTGFAVTPDSKDVAAGIVEDVNKTYGRGIARVRPTNYFQYTIWTEKEKNDLRGRYNHDSWRRMEDLIYNDPARKKANDPWYGKKAVCLVAIPSVAGFHGPTTKYIFQIQQQVAVNGKVVQVLSI